MQAFKQATCTRCLSKTKQFFHTSCIDRPIHVLTCCVPVLPAGCAAAQADSSQLHVGQTDALFPGGAVVQPTPLPLGPAYNTSSFRAFMNVTLQCYADAPAAGFAVTQGSLGTLVNLLGQLYLP